MDPATLVTQALAAGTSAGLANATSAAVFDAYRALRQACLQRLLDRHRVLYTDDVADAAPAPAPELVRQLIASGGLDTHIVHLAQRLLALADPAGTRSGTYRVDLRSAQGVQVGDHNTQNNTFG